jgi:hypothetical protein
LRGRRCTKAPMAKSNINLRSFTSFDLTLSSPQLDYHLLPSDLSGNVLWASFLFFSFPFFASSKLRSVMSSLDTVDQRQILNHRVDTLNMLS